MIQFRSFIPFLLISFGVAWGILGQVNIAITEMDKVVQQNATNSEESASASEKMNAQAEQLRGKVESDDSV